MNVCPTCRGLGEVPVPGTHGPTVSPELLETRTCPRCHGEGGGRGLDCSWHFTDNNMVD